MTGTEKQISFARDLVEKMNTQFDALISDCKATVPGKREHVGILQGRLQQNYLRIQCRTCN